MPAHDIVRKQSAYIVCKQLDNDARHCMQTLSVGQCFSIRRGLTINRFGNESERIETQVATRENNRN